MIVHRSNRADELLEVLCALVAEPEADPFARECIAVQGRGMERWLSLSLAQAHGVWANPDFPFPRHLVDRILDACAEGPPLSPEPAASGLGDGDVWDPETLLWSIAAELPRLAGEPGAEELARYLAGDGGGLLRFQLAQRVAEVFDRYVLYRPAMLLAWERDANAGDGWQPELWRRLVDRHGGAHLARRVPEATRALGRAEGPVPGLPARVSLFGVTALPPLYLDLLHALALRIPVHLFVLTAAPPRPETPVQGDLFEAAPATSSSLAVHPLHRSLGRVGCEFGELLEARRPGAGRLDVRDRFVPASGEHALARLQRALLQGEPGDGERPLQPGDASIRVHECAGPLREVEVLHDQLVQAFESDATLEPRDVIVMAPDVEAYAPFVEAVFGASGAPESERPRIPYRIADRRVRATHAVVDALGLLLDAATGRMTATGLLDLLLVDVIRTRAGIAAGELERARELVHDAGICWGADAGHRESFGQPALEQNTWRFGLDRLLLARALPSTEQLWQGVVPVEGVDADSADLAGRLADFAESLFDFARRLEAPRPVTAWRDELALLLDRMVARGEEEAAQQAFVRTGLDELVRRAARAGFDGPVPLGALRSQLERALQRAAPVHGFLSGGVTFCEMIPMRSIPFRVVALLGMDDASFPRSMPPLGFDLAARDRQTGDRSPRDDDRTLFLEGLLSAREQLIVTHAGQSPRDGSARPPSVVVSELLDELVRADSTGRPADEVRGSLVVRHPLQAFSPRYFEADGDPRLFSHATGELEAARALWGPAQPPVAFVRDPIPGDPVAAAADGELAVDDLVRFLERPVRTFLQRRLRLYLGRRDVPELDDREPQELDALARWRLGDELLEHELGGRSREDARALVRAQGLLPPGAAGRAVAVGLEEVVSALADRVRSLRGEPRAPLAVDLRVAGFHLTGTLRDLYEGGQVLYQYSTLPHRRELGLWVRHLVLCCLEPAPGPSFLVGRGKPVATVRLEPVDDAPGLLADLLALYRAGLEAPLPLPPQTAQAWGLARFSGKPGAPAKALAAARNAWEGRGVIAAESQDDYLLQAFGDIDLLDPEVVFAGGHRFEDVAGAVYEPLMRFRSELAR